MSAVDDLKTSLQNISDEADSIAVGIKAIRDAQATGNQAAVDAAIADLNNSVTTVKQHVDAARDALSAAPVDTPPSA